MADDAVASGEALNETYWLVKNKVSKDGDIITIYKEDGITVGNSLTYLMVEE